MLFIYFADRKLMKAVYSVGMYKRQNKQDGALTLQASTMF